MGGERGRIFLMELEGERKGGGGEVEEYGEKYFEGEGLRWREYLYILFGPSLRCRSQANRISHNTGL